MEGTSCPRMPQSEITEFMEVSHSEADDSQRCRRIIGQLLFDKKQLLAKLDQQPELTGITAELRAMIADDHCSYGVTTVLLSKALQVCDILDRICKKASKLEAENEKYKAVGENDWDLRCVNIPTGGGDYSVEWLIVEHYMASPKERPIGHGETPLEAIMQALNKEKKLYDERPRTEIEINEL